MDEFGVITTIISDQNMPLVLSILKCQVQPADTHCTVRYVECVCVCVQKGMVAHKTIFKDTTSLYNLPRCLITDEDTSMPGDIVST